MTDYISRQTAIDALEDTKQNDPFDRYEYQNIGIEWAIDALKALPSAQPEQRWIPCSERLPEEAGWYIASGVRDVGNRWYSTLHGWEETTFRVVAWMPLPEPYGEVSE